MNKHIKVFKDLIVNAGLVIRNIYTLNTMEGNCICVEVSTGHTLKHNIDTNTYHIFKGWSNIATPLTLTKFNQQIATLI